MRFRILPLQGWEQLKNPLLASALRVRFYADFLLAFSDQQTFPARDCAELAADLKALICEASFGDEY